MPIPPNSKPPEPDRFRSFPRRWGWLDARLMESGTLVAMTGDEAILYLSAVGVEHPEDHQEQCPNHQVVALARAHKGTQHGALQFLPPVALYLFHVRLPFIFSCQGQWVALRPWEYGVLPTAWPEPGM